MKTVPDSDLYEPQQLQQSMWNNYTKAMIAPNIFL